MYRIFLTFLAALAAGALGGCAPLPDIAALIASTAGSTRIPDVIGAHGPLPARRGQELLQRLLAAGPAPGMLKEHLPVAAAISPAPLAVGNRATLLASGPDIERAVLDAIANAKSSIDIETYIIADDAAGRRLADLLVQKRAEHVAVNVIYDALASRDTPQAYFDRLRQAGVRTLEFNPINPLATRVAWAPNQRDHRKVFIVDGAVAILGGANVELPAEARNDTWRDTDIRIDRRSFLFNHEVNAFVYDGKFARQLETLFEHDVAGSRRIVSERWQRRAVTQRVAEWSADLFSYWW